MYPKQPKWSQKRSQNEPRSLQRHPCRTGSKNNQKMMPKDANPAAHFWIEIIENLKYHPLKYSKINHGETLTIRSKRCQKGSRNHRNLNLFVKWWLSANVGFSIAERSTFRIEDPKIQEETTKTKSQNMFRNWMQKYAKSHQKMLTNGILNPERTRKSMA